MSKEEAIQENLYYYSENIGGSFFVRVSTELPDDYVFTQSNLSIGDIKDGVFGVEQKRIDGEIPYVVYRYSNYVPKGEKLRDSFRVVVEDKVYYIWRKAEYGELVGFDTIDNLVGRVNVLWWGILDGDALTPHVFSFLREQD